MSRLKIDGTKVNIIEAKTNFIERLEYEKFYKIKDAFEIDHLIYKNLIKVSLKINKIIFLIIFIKKCPK